MRSDYIFPDKCKSSTYDQVTVNAIASEDSGIYSPVPVEKSMKDPKGIIAFSIGLPFAGKYLIDGFHIKQKSNASDFAE